MFCQLVHLRSCIPQDESIRRALDELPETLDETYARSLEEIGEKKWKYAHLIFQCVAAASRPLLVSELAEFFAFDFDAGSIPTLLADRRLEDPAHTVLSVCSSLLVIVEPGSGSPVVQFAHFSVKEYLMSARLSEANNTISRFHVSMSAAHAIIAQACLGVLLHLDGNVTTDSLENFPLAEYAAEHWVGHARFENVLSEVQDGMKRLFDPGEGHLSAWVWIYDLEDHQHRFRLSERPVKARATSLHYAAFCGIHDVAAFLIIEHSQNVNAQGFNDETPLHVASRHGHADIAQLLLKHGADVEARSGAAKYTPLLLASKGGHVEVVRVLLKHGADIEAQNKSEWSPLALASFFRHVEIARVLLEHGADVTAKAVYIDTPLHLARGEEVILFLLRHGADANSLNTIGRTPLHQASERGIVENARALLGHGVDANSRDADNATPLHLASCSTFKFHPNAHPDIARLLLQYGADIHARDNKGRTPFMRAIEKGEDSMIRLLLECGAKDHRM